MHHKRGDERTVKSNCDRKRGDNRTVETNCDYRPPSQRRERG